jgi:HD-GYP domain-containing protein (c-di-GMP phosphodiesterase class II)
MIDLGTGAMLHDIGKIFIPESIIDKPGPLDRREYDIMKDHVLFGYDYLKSTISEEDILHIVRDHHERLDGRGYPNGLEGEEIGRNSRIVSAADVYCALVSDRSYRKGYTFEQAISIMKTEFAGKALAREIVEALETYLT